METLELFLELFNIRFVTLEDWQLLLSYKWVLITDYINSKLFHVSRFVRILGFLFQFILINFLTRF